MKKIWTFVMFLTLLAACQESLEDKCEREAKDYTRRNCPMKMDNNSILDSLVFERSTHTIHYYYTLTGFADQDSILEKVNAVEVLRESGLYLPVTKRSKEDQDGSGIYRKKLLKNLPP